MKLLDDWRYNQGLKRLKRGMPGSRMRRFQNYEASTQVGIVYLVKDVDQHDTIHQYIKHLKENEGMKEVQAIGFWDSSDDVPEFLQARRHFDFFTRKDITKMHEPLNDAAREFCSREFDILIDLTREPVLPLLFVLRDSVARCKVGFPDPLRDPFLDMIMEVPEQKSLRESIEAVNYYLTILNRKVG
jgi:hypothetical protein